MRKTIKVKGMSCQHCALAVQKALQRVDGITDIEVDLEKGEVHFEETRPVTRDAIRAEVAAAGYELA